jgi:hypothetical protein
MSEEQKVYEVSTIDEASTPIADDTLISLAEQAEKRIDAMNKIKRVALKLTNRGDWVDQGGKPFLQSSGAERIARMFGISWRISEPTYEQLEGGHFSYTYKGYFTLAGATIEAIGTRSSKDPFFKRYSYIDGKKTELPVSEIDRGDLKKAAYTNLIGGGICRLLGIRNLTYEDLKEFAGITPDMIGRIDYKKEGKADKPIADEAAKTVAVIVMDVRKRDGVNKNTKKPFTKYTVKDSQEVEYNTFSESFAKIAKQGKENGTPVSITFVTGTYGNDIQSLQLAAPEERIPGEEG